DVLPLAGPFAGKKGGGYRLGGKDRGGLVGDNRADHPWPARLRSRLEVGEARQALDYRVVYPLLGIGPPLADAADRDIDQPGIFGAQRRPAEAKAFHRPRPKILDQYIRAANQLAHDCRRLGPLQVERQRTLAAVRRDEQRGEFTRRANRLSALARDIAAER